MPPLASTALPQKIAFATDLDEKDIPILRSLATFAHDLKAEIIIVHIDAGSYGHEIPERSAAPFLDKVREDIGFTAFSYRNIESKDIAGDLNHIAAMVRDLRIPLLVHPKDKVPAAYPVF